MSVVNSLALYGTRQSLWSDSRSERLMAAQFLATGELLEAQAASLEMQQQLCQVATRTNRLLAGIDDTLSSLLEAQGATNALLQKSLDIQTEQLRLLTRERAVKDAIFRWSELLSRGEGLKDPHWVLIATRTCTTFLEANKVATHDVSDLGDKRALLDLIQQVNTLGSGISTEVRNEVNVFQALYKEVCDLRANPLRPVSFKAAGVKEPPQLQLPQLDARPVLASCFEPSISSVSSPIIFLSLLTMTFDVETQLKAAEPKLEPGERRVLVVSGRSGILSRLTLFTTHAWHTLLPRPSFFGPKAIQTRHSYDEEYRYWEENELWTPVADAKERIQQLKEFGIRMREQLVLHTQKVELAKQKHEERLLEHARVQEADKANEAKARQRAKEENEQAMKEFTMKVKVGVDRINEYLGIHPTVSEFYPALKAKG